MKNLQGLLKRKFHYSLDQLLLQCTQGFDNTTMRIRDKILLAVLGLLQGRKSFLT